MIAKLLVAAAGNGHKEVVKFLIERGADPDENWLSVKTSDKKKVRYDTTPLYEAATYGHTEVVHLLLDKGAYPEGLDYNRLVGMVKRMLLSARSSMIKEQI